MEEENQQGKKFWELRCCVGNAIPRVSIPFIKKNSVGEKDSLEGNPKQKPSSRN